jgi:nitrogen fixation protein NifU and related proteins
MLQRNYVRVRRTCNRPCGPTIASGSMLTEMIAGKSIVECRELTAENLIEALDGMPPDRLHCPALAIGAPNDALAKWPISREEPQGNAH